MGSEGGARVITVLVVDDHPLFREGVLASMEQQEDFKVVGQTDAGTKALELIAATRPNLLLIDIRLKGETNGIEAARLVREQHPETKIVVLTNFCNEPYVRAMMEIGVEGYLLKDTPAREVIDALRIVVTGQTVFAQQVTQAMVEGYLAGSDDAESRKPERLTRRESDVLDLLAQGHSNPVIAERLNVSSATVQYHLTSIYSKLGVSSRAEAIIAASRRGLVVIDL